MGDTKTVVPLRGVRAMISDKMVRSLQEAAQLTHHASCDVSGLLAQKEVFAARGDKVSIEDLLMHQVVSVLRKHPDINGTVADKAIHLSDAVDLCVAIALPGNLLVAPSIFGAEQMDVLQLRAARQDLSARAKTNKLSVTEMTGGSFTISNLGLTRVEQFTPILNTPQIGILGIGCIREVAVRSGDNMLWKPMMGLSLTFDHRAIDGGPAAAFLSDLCHSIEALA
ncbi:2-oxo acid dehydrogenase subunit E2 [Leucothrix mucor]|uniref:2-oxo acid dehydrogenase subunit E2 n=1 Tax=Leucothrix mucor TaxID=45248 RepID=UPI0003FDE58B|nr:2-oxo acid dehydrogenase subunit E2 [Leucothrix mucor]